MPGIPDAVASAVLADLNVNSVFKELTGHMVNSTVMDNHVFRLIKTIARCYSKIKLHHLGKVATQNTAEQHITKTVQTSII